MKIRNGFVSNSSSTSFCIYGTCITLDYCKKLLEFKGTNYDLISFIENKLSSNWIVLTGPDDDTNLYIGKEWSTIGKKQTGEDFIKEIEKKLENIFGLGIDCDTHTESWYNG